MKLLEGIFSVIVASIALAPRARRPWLPVLLLPLLLLGAGSCELVRVGVPTTDGRLPIQIVLPTTVDPTEVRVALDGVDVTASFGPGGPGLLGSIPLPDPGPYRIWVTRPFDLGFWTLHLTGRHLFESPAAAPDLLSAEPGNGATEVPRTDWLRLVFDAALDKHQVAGWGFGLECDGKMLDRSRHRRDHSVVVNPAPELPAAAHCRVAWRGSDGAVAEIAFEVAPDAPGPAATVLYDRTDVFQLAPFPDDFFVAADGSLDIRFPPFADPVQVMTFNSLAASAQNPDGWSRQAPIVVAFSHALDPSAVPADESESIDPLAPVSLVDVDRTSPDYGNRIPYRMLLRTDTAPDGTPDHVAMLFASIDLRERGQYAIVVTRRAFAQGEPGRPFVPSTFFDWVAGEPQPAEVPEIEKARGSVGPALESIAVLPDVPIPTEDVALALRISVRTHPSVDDLVHIKERALAQPPPQLILPDPDVDPCPDPASMCLSLSDDRALEVRGAVLLPDFRVPGSQFARDAVTGLPVETGVNQVPVRMTLPVHSLDEPVHPIMYQHGNPGSPDEIFYEASHGHLDDAGFAMVAIEDTLNRDVGGSNLDLQVERIFLLTLLTEAVPLFWNQTASDQIHFLRAIQGMGSLDLLRKDASGDPEIGPDGSPEIDPSIILYKGISEGGSSAQRFLPFAPEILAAVPTVGGNRLIEQLIHQTGDGDGILDTLTGFLPQARPVELWVGLSLFQAGFDAQDGHTYLRYLYREPLTPFAGSTDTTPPSTLWTEGLGDSQLPNNASRAMAHELGIPHVLPVVVPLPNLPQVDSPLVDNLGPGLTAGFFQYDPANTPSCLLLNEPDGHYCPLVGDEPKAQRLHFFETAIDGAAEILNPLP